MASISRKKSANARNQIRQAVRRTLIVSAIAAAMASMGTVSAAPPVEGVPTIEQSVARGCRAAQVVMIARMTAVREVGRDGETWQTGKVTLHRLLKGAASDVPSTYAVRKHIPNRTDQLGEQLEEGMVYLMFLRHDPPHGWMGTIHRELNWDFITDAAGASRMVKTDRFFRHAVALTEAACR